MILIPGPDARAADVRRFVIRGPAIVADVRDAAARRTPGRAVIYYAARPPAGSRPPPPPRGRHRHRRRIPLDAARARLALT